MMKSLLGHNDAGRGNTLERELRVSEPKASNYDEIFRELKNDYDDAKDSSEIRISDLKAIANFVFDDSASGSIRSRIIANALKFKYLVESQTGVLYPFKFNPITKLVANVMKSVYNGPKIPLGHGKSVNIGLKDLNPITAVKDAFEILKSLFGLIFSIKKPTKSE